MTLLFKDPRLQVSGPQACGYGRLRNVFAMTRADFKQMMDDSCSVNGNVDCQCSMKFEAGWEKPCVFMEMRSQ